MWQPKSLNIGVIKIFQLLSKAEFEWELVPGAPQS